MRQQPGRDACMVSKVLSTCKRVMSSIPVDGHLLSDATCSSLEFCMTSNSCSTTRSSVERDVRSDQAFETLACTAHAAIVSYTVGVYSNLQRAMYARAVSALAIYGTSGRVPILLDSSVFTKQEVDAACAHVSKPPDCCWFYSAMLPCGSCSCWMCVLCLLSRSARVYKLHCMLEHAASLF